MRCSAFDIATYYFVIIEVWVLRNRAMNATGSLEKFILRRNCSQYLERTDYFIFLLMFH